VIIVRDLPLAPTALWVGRGFGVPVVLDMAENYAAMIQDIWRTGRAGRWDFLVRNPKAIAAVERYVAPRVDHVITVVEESSTRVAALGVPRGTAHGGVEYPSGGPRVRGRDAGATGGRRSS
jgi:hypothetical protein